VALTAGMSIVFSVIDPVRKGLVGQCNRGRFHHRRSPRAMGKCQLVESAAQETNGLRSRRSYAGSRRLQSPCCCAFATVGRAPGGRPGRAKWSLRFLPAYQSFLEHVVHARGICRQRPPAMRGPNNTRATPGSSAVGNLISSVLASCTQSPS
jgi:hypothetical protein